MFFRQKRKFKDTMITSLKYQKKTLEAKGISFILYDKKKRINGAGRPVSAFHKKTVSKSHSRPIFVIAMEGVEKYIGYVFGRKL